MAAAPTYHEVKDSARAATRRAVVDGAVRVLEAEGAAGLSIRRVAAEIGTSTKVLYTTFGDKGGLIEALAEEGFERLCKRLDAAPRRREPGARLLEFAHTYLAFARDEPTFFSVMYGAPFAEHFPSKQSRGLARASFDRLVAAVIYAQQRGAIDSGDPLAPARTLWAAMHGPAQLELHGWLTRAETDRQVPLLVTAAITALNDPVP